MEKVSGRRWYLVSLLSLLYVISCVDRYILFLFVAPIKAEMGITDTQIALLFGPAFGFFYAIAGLPIAWLIDRGNRTLIACSGVAIWSLSTVAAAFTSSYEQLIVLRMLVALGEAVLSPAAISLIADYFHRNERSTPTAVYVSSGLAGSMLAFTVGGLIIQFAEHGGFSFSPFLDGLPVWRLALIIVGCPGIFIAALVYLTTREPVRGRLDGATTQNQKQPRLGSFSSAKQAVRFYILYFSGIALLISFTYSGTVWFPTHLTRVLKIDAATSGYIMGTAIALSGVFSLTIPALMQKMTKDGQKVRILEAYLFAMPMGCVCFLVSLFLKSLTWVTLFAAFGKGLLGALAALAPIVISLTAPAAFRGRLVAANLATQHIIGLGLGPLVTAMLSDYIFKGPMGLAYAMATLGMFVLPVSGLSIYLASRILRKESSEVVPRIGEPTSSALAAKQ
ncbi:MAG: MFS transporter [Nitrospira sp.]